MANSMDPEQTAPIGCYNLLNLSEMLGNFLQQTTSADYTFRCIFFLALRISISYFLSFHFSFIYRFFFCMYILTF